MPKMTHETRPAVPPQIGEDHTQRSPAKRDLTQLCALAILFGAVLIGLSLSRASGQRASTSTPTSPVSLPTIPVTMQMLLEQAHAFEVRGDLALASRSWQQVLLADPNNLEALGGLARAATESKNLPLASLYRERLYAIRPAQPAPPSIASVPQAIDHTLELQQASKLAQQGEYAQATKLYRQVYADIPPKGEAALLFYETEAATEEGRPHAIAALRLLTEENPNDPRDRVALARILTYNPATRAEGRKLLASLPKDTQALGALRQSLLWDARDPAALSEIRAYLAHHSDAQLSRAMKSQTSAVLSPGIAQPGIAQPSSIHREQATALPVFEPTPVTENQAADRALAEAHIVDAEQRFKSILKATPNDAHALLGMGHIRMQQANFSGALTFLLHAKEADPKQPGIDLALNDARLQFLLSQGASEYEQNHLSAAETQYRAALAMQPSSTESLEGLGDVLLKANQHQAAAACFTKLVKLQPSAPPAWRGLFLAEANGGDVLRALQTERQLPPKVRSALVTDPLFLRALSSAYSATGRQVEAQQTLRSALDLPYAPEEKNLQKETQLQYAGLLQQAAHPDQAAALYRQVLAADQDNAAAWQGLIHAEHAMKLDQQALETFESMPPATRAQLEHDPTFQQTITSIYSALGRTRHANRLPQLSQPLSIEPSGPAERSEPSVRPAFYVSLSHPVLTPAIFREPQTLALTQLPQAAELGQSTLSAQLKLEHRAQPLTVKPVSDPASAPPPSQAAPVVEEIYGTYVPYQAPLQALPISSLKPAALSPIRSAKPSPAVRVVPPSSSPSAIKVKTATAVEPAIRVLPQQPQSSRFGESKPPIEDYNTPLPEATQPAEPSRPKVHAPSPK